MSLPRGANLTANSANIALIVWHLALFLVAPSRTPKASPCTASCALDTEMAGSQVRTAVRSMYASHFACEAGSSGLAFAK